MRYTVINTNSQIVINVPDDVVIVGIDYTWKYVSRTNMVYFTRFDAFLEFINSEDTDKYGIPMCCNQLITDANRIGRFNVIRNVLRAKKMQYYDYIGDAYTCIVKVMSGHTYLPYDDTGISNATVDHPASQVSISSKGNAQPLVSVIVPHYNRSNVVMKSIVSLLKQTHRNLEILIADDHSDESHFEKLKSYLNELGDSRIYLYRLSKNCGPYVCKNEMIRIARGVYITMQDSDDISDEARIGEQVKCFLDNPNIVSCSVYGYRKKTKEEYAYCMASAMYDKKVFSEIGFFDSVRYGGDSEFSHRLRAYYGTDRVKVIASRMCHIGFDEDCLTSVVPPNSKSRNDYYNACLKYVRDQNDKKKLYLPYPQQYRKFTAAPEMVSDTNGLSCQAIDLQNHACDVQSHKKVNIVISAYNCVEYIEECLDSVASQTYQYHEILLGIDGCAATLEKVKAIAHKYDRLKVYYAANNTGPYMVYNSLIKLIPDDQYFVIFGADDVMHSNMLELLVINDTAKICKHDGVLFIKKMQFAQIGGFRPWRCAADSDSVFRMRKLYPVLRTPIYFTLRKHDRQLTKHPSTNLSSNLRSSYIKIYDENVKSEHPVIYINPEYNPIELVTIHKRFTARKPITVNMATYPARRESFLKCVSSLLKISAIDIVRVYLNEYKKVPSDFPKDARIQYVVGKKDLKDTGKFYRADKYNNEYYFTIDDDLIYSETFFEEHVKTLERYNSNIFVTIHGKLTSAHPKSFMDVKKPIFHCLHENVSDAWVMIGGTGVMVFDNSKFKIPLDMFKYHGMCDLWIAAFCQKNRIPILCRKHAKTDVVLINPENDDTLWHKRDSMAIQHKEILDSVTWQVFTIIIQE